MLNLTDMRKRRKFDREFKQMVIELSHNREDTGALASELDISADLIYRWRRDSWFNWGLTQQKNFLKNSLRSLVVLNGTWRNILIN